MEEVDVLSGLEAVNDSSVSTHVQLKSLDEVATVALTCSDKVSRDAAARHLRHLSTYEHWNTTKTLLTMATEYRYLHFMVCKAALFLVSNEIGPDERREVQYIVLNYLKNLRENGKTLKHFVRHELYAILSSATYLNWKLDVLTAEQEDQEMTTRTANSTEKDAQTTVGRNRFATILGFFQAYLTAEEYLDCLLEMIPHFTQQCIKVPIFSTRLSFVRFALPYFFEEATHLLVGVPTTATQVCCVVLECLSEVALFSEEPLVNIRHYREGSIHLVRWEEWSSSLPIALQYAKNMLIQHPTSEDALLYGRLLRLCSTLSCSEESFMISARPAMTQEMILLSSELLKICRGNNALMEHLHLACDVLINTFERDEESVLAYLTGNIEFISVWTEATQYVLSRFTDDEDDLRQSLMHLFYLFADQLLPAPLQNRQRDFNDFLENAIIIQPCDAEEGEINCSSSLASVEAKMGQELDKIVSSSDGPMGPESSQHLKDLVFSIFTTYFNSVISKAHLKEDSQELRTEAGVVLHNEKTLLPLASMLFCKRIDFQSFLLDRLLRNIEDYRMLVSIREARWWSSQVGIGAISTVTQTFSSNITAKEKQALTLLVERFPGVKSEISRNCAYFGNGCDSNSSNTRTESLNGICESLSYDAIEMLLMRVILTHLSVMISIFAIAMMNDTAPGDNSVLAPIAKFARQLLTGDDKLTNNLLQCLLISENDTMGHAENSSKISTSNNSQVQVHLGILRALFFFCNCVCESDFLRRPEFSEISLDLLRYVYLHHSDIPCLVTDANLLLLRIITNTSRGIGFLGSEKLLAVIQAVSDDEIPILRVGYKMESTIPPLPREVRTGFYTAFMTLVEARHQTGYGVDDAVAKLVARMVSPEYLYSNPAQMLIDLTALARGVQRPATLLVMLERVLDCKDELLHIMSKDANCATLVVRCLSALCTLAQNLLDDNPTSELHWCLGSFVMRVMNYYFDLVSFNSSLSRREDAEEGYRSNGEEHFVHSNPIVIFDFDPDRMEAAVVYDLSDFLYCMYSASWSNLAIIHHYERNTVEKFFSGSVQFLTSLPVTMLMSSESGRSRVFNAMLAVLVTDGPFFQNLHHLLSRQNLWDQILRYLTKCLAYCYLPIILKLMFVIVHNEIIGGCNKNQRDVAPLTPTLSPYDILPERTLGLVLREVVLLVAVSPYLEKNECAHAFFLIEACFRRAPALCTDHFVRLLDVCSAYHRVRIRHIMNNVREGHDYATLMSLYLRCFGQSSKVSTLAAW